MYCVYFNIISCKMCWNSFGEFTCFNQYREYVSTTTAQGRVCRGSVAGAETGRGRGISSPPPPVSEGHNKFKFLTINSETRISGKPSSYLYKKLKCPKSRRKSNIHGTDQNDQSQDQLQKHAFKRYRRRSPHALAHFASHRCGPGSIPGLGCRGRMCEKFHQLLAVGRWFPPGTPVSSTRKLISSSFHRLDMTLAVAEALNPNKPNQTKPNPVVSAPP